MIIQNAVLHIASNKIYVSTHVHDFVSLPGGDFLDGGNNYRRASLRHRQDYEDLYLTEDDPFYKIYDLLVWGTRGPDGSQPLTYKFMHELDTSHLINLLAYFEHPSFSAKVHPIRKKVVESILKGR